MEFFMKDTYIKFRCTEQEKATIEALANMDPDASCYNYKKVNAAR